MPLPWTFGPLTGSISLSDLDQNFAALGNNVVLPCTVSGADTLALALNTNTPTIAAYTNYMCFSGVAASDNTTTVTAAIGSLPALNVYKDSLNGPAALAGGEIQAGAAIWLTYDSALNSGAGGFHLQTGSAILKNQTINPTAIVLGSGGTLANIARRAATLTFSVTPANSTNDVTATLTGVVVGDFVQVSPLATVATPAGVGYTGFIAAAGTVTVRQLNVTAGTLGAFTTSFNLAAVRLT